VLLGIRARAGERHAYMGDCCVKLWRGPVALSRRYGEGVHPGSLMNGMSGERTRPEAERRRWDSRSPEATVKAKRWRPRPQSRLALFSRQWGDAIRLAVPRIVHALRHRMAAHCIGGDRGKQGLQVIDWRLEIEPGGDPIGRQDHRYSHVDRLRQRLNA
jgi:hypothetical protein